MAPGDLFLFSAISYGRYEARGLCGFARLFGGPARRPPWVKGGLPRRELPLLRYNGCET